MTTQPFWKRLSLAQMTRRQWESLCDGCGKCCRHKIEDADTGRIVHTRVACRLLDVTTVRCGDYPRRHVRVPTCVRLSPEHIPDWLPDTCAYKRVDAGRDLPDWHPLVTGDPQSVHRAGASVRGNVIPELALPGTVEDYPLEDIAATD